MSRGLEVRLPRSHENALQAWFFQRGFCARLDDSPTHRAVMQEDLEADSLADARSQASRVLSCSSIWKTTGSDATADRITEIGVVEASTAGIERYSVLVDPGVPVAPFIERLRASMIRCCAGSLVRIACARACRTSARQALRRAQRALRLWLFEERISPRGHRVSCGYAVHRAAVARAVSVGRKAWAGCRHRASESAARGTSSRTRRCRSALGSGKRFTGLSAASDRCGHQIARETREFAACAARRRARCVAVHAPACTSFRRRRSAALRWQEHQSEATRGIAFRGRSSAREGLVDLAIDHAHRVPRDHRRTRRAVARSEAHEGSEAGLHPPAQARKSSPTCRASAICSACLRYARRRWRICVNSPMNTSSVMRRSASKKPRPDGRTRGCFGHQVKRCLGACVGEESLGDHAAREAVACNRSMGAISARARRA